MTGEHQMTISASWVLICDGKVHAYRTAKTGITLAIITEANPIFVEVFGIPGRSFSLFFHHANDLDTLKRLVETLVDG